jgi:hypothetical protein
MAEKHVTDVGHVEANGNFDRAWRDEKIGDQRLSVVAQDRAIDEKEMTIRQALKIYKKAVMWAFIVSCVVIMEGTINPCNLLLIILTMHRLRYESPGKFLGSSRFPAPLWRLCGRHRPNSHRLLHSCLLADWPRSRSRCWLYFRNDT